MDILETIKKEHKEAAAMLDQVQGLEPDDPRTSELAKKIEFALTTHVQIEERLFYARLRDRAEEEEQSVDVFEAYTEHELARHLISLLKSRRKRDARFKAELQVLGESIKHHVQEEESTVFSLARKLIDRDELEELGAKWQSARQRLGSTPDSTPAARSTAKRRVSTPARPPARAAAAGRTAKKRSR